MYDSNIKLNEINDIIKNEYSIVYSIINNNRYSNRLEDQSDWCEADCFKNYIVEIYLSDYNGEEKIGELSFTEIDINSMDFHGIDRLDIFDAIDQEKYELGYFLENSFKLKQLYQECTSIIYIDRFLINKTIRGNGIAHKILNEITNVIQWFLNYKPDFIVLNSWPFEYASENKHLKESNDKDLNDRYNKDILNLKEKLNKLYLNCGFCKDEGSHFENTYFYKEFK